MDFEKEAKIEANNLTEEQLERFYQELNKVPSVRSPLTGDQAVLSFRFMEDTGLRVNEMLHVLKRDISFDTRILTVTMPKVSALCPCAKWEYRDLRTRIRVITETDKSCKKCHGEGRFKQIQNTTITPRLISEIIEYCKDLESDKLLFPVHRSTLWKWAKKAGEEANLDIFQMKKIRRIDGLFLHLFRALCAKRMIKDAVDDPFRDQLIAQKLRHSFASVTDRYTKVDINYLWNWEKKTYGN